MKRHAKPTHWQPILVVLIAATVMGLAAGYITGYPAIMLAGRLLTENIGLTAQRDWYAERYHDRPPVVDLTGAWP